VADTILITGVIDLDPANHDAAVAAFTKVMKASLQDEGCERYVFSADLEQPGRFHLSEEWASQAASDAHMTKPHMAEFFSVAGQLGITSSSVTKWTGATPEKLM